MKIKELFEANEKNQERDRINEIIKGWRSQLKRITSKPFGQFTFNDKDEVIFMGECLEIKSFMLVDDELPFKFVSCNRLRLTCPDLKSFKNFPNIISHSNQAKFWPASFEMDAAYNDTITSLEGFPPLVNGYADFSHFQGLNFSRCDKFIKGLDYIRLPEHYDGPILSLLKIRNLTSVIPGSSKTPWLKIMNKHLDGSRDILECQDELIEAGLKDFAKL